ncbi:LpxI family protein [Tropicimonas sp. IMCC6043]|uniref:LpxI family protein n=1 Tax=Tropicimonas sp. IMCC6043 TaxID=2510645 RepID=UPI00101CB2E6|nr:UDP-2,3-diacylglucosamine diphosphatase LpxI [Tropicimonas sp. IMCC6043]RYH08546.1 LpxI family protein [Tropicimonas sp. IMCC6043]
MLALIAGNGRLPELLAERWRQAGRELMVCAYSGAPEAVPPDIRFRLESLGGLVRRLRREGVHEVCFAGGITRPKLSLRYLDFPTLLLVPRLVRALGKGDDGALRELIALFEENGMAVRGAHEILPELLPEPGVPTRAQPGPEDRKDAARGEAIVTAMGAADVGQACVVARRQALAIEAMPGTDWMLASLRHRPDGLPEGGLLFKAPKPGQDRRVDLPTIGPATIRAAGEAGLRGVVIEAGGVILLDREAALEAADAAGLFLWVRPRGG